MADLIRPMKGELTQTFDGAFPAERPGYIRTDIIPFRGKRVPFKGGRFRKDLHLGLDYAGAHGIRIYAMATGPIVDQGVDWTSGGAWFIQQRVHRGPNFDFYMLYYHLKANSSRFPNGAIPEQADVIARNGSTGWSTGAHVHVELSRLPRGASYTEWYSGTRIDPLAIIRDDASFSEID